MENLHLKVEGPQGDIVFRQGEALPLKEPVKILIEGNIKAISSFLSVRNINAHGSQVIDKTKAIVSVDRKSMLIHLRTDPESVYGAEILARLEFSDELLNFNINSQKTYDKQELVKLLRFNRLYFSDFDKHSALLAAYQSFSAKADTNIKDEADMRGNKIANFSKKVTTNIPTGFILHVPIFKGMEKRSFRVEICLDVTDGGARFWFESVELNEIIIKERDEIINKELKSCAGLVIIEK